LNGHGVVYQLINSKADEHGERRVALEQFVRRCCEQGATDTEAIVVLALIHLKQLDEQTASRRAGPRSGKNGTSDPTSS
jgi:hypothetical protein